jgi:hypothetical protein
VLRVSRIQAHCLPIQDVNHFSWTQSQETVDKKTPEPLSPNDPISAKEMESQTIRASLEVTRRTLSSRFGNSGSLVSKNLSSRFGDSGGSFDHGASFASTRGDGGAGGDGQHSESRDSFVPKLGQQNAKLLATAGRHSTLSLSVSDYKELSLQLREEEAREAREREDNNKGTASWAFPNPPHTVLSLSW